MGQRGTRRWHEPTGDLQEPREGTLRMVELEVDRWQCGDQSVSQPGNPEGVKLGRGD